MSYAYRGERMEVQTFFLEILDLDQSIHWKGFNLVTCNRIQISDICQKKFDTSAPLWLWFILLCNFVASLVQLSFLFKLRKGASITRFVCRSVRVKILYMSLNGKIWQQCENKSCQNSCQDPQNIFATDN